MNPTTRWITLAAGLLGFLGVILGALGAHALKATLLANGQLDSWKTAILYQFVHAIALLVLANARETESGPNSRVAVCWVTGVVLFSGSIYGLALGGPGKILGPITPLGGLALLAGWALLVFNAWRRPKA